MTIGSRHLCRRCTVTPYIRRMVCAWATNVCGLCEVVLEDGKLQEDIGRATPERLVMVKAE